MKILFQTWLKRDRTAKKSWMNNTWDEFAVMRNMMSCWR